jgi:hypothetical protein
MPQDIWRLASEHFCSAWKTEIFNSRLGGVAERFKAAVLKTVVRKHRGFESYLLRQI